MTLAPMVVDGPASGCPPRKLRVRLVVIGFGCLVAAAALLALVPAVPATWASLRYWHGVTDAAFPNGYVTVTSCSRGSLAVDWTCRGTFRVNDPMAEPVPSGPLRGVVLAMTSVTTRPERRCNPRFDLVAGGLTYGVTPRLRATSSRGSLRPGCVCWA